jgi:cleavage and polyadenylation specificity factor subunit 1
MLNSYEFAQNEFVNAVESIPLETLSTERGLKDYIVVGTTISRGEDLAVKGAVSAPSFNRRCFLKLYTDLRF